MTRPDDVAHADDAPRVPVLAWRHAPGTALDPESYYVILGEGLRGHVESDGAGTWIVYAGHPEGCSPVAWKVTPAEAMLAAEAHLRQVLHRLAPLFATGGTDAE